MANHNVPVAADGHAAPAHGETHATTEAHGGPAEHHAEPTAFGLTPPMWVALAMVAVFAILLWKRVPALIGKALDRKIAGIREQLDEAATLRAESFESGTFSAITHKTQHFVFLCKKMPRQMRS